MTTKGGAPDLPLVSVVIPTHNRAGLVSRAVDSILRQCIDGDEVIVVDDGSTDDTASVLSGYRDRIVYLHSPHQGAGNARNAGIGAAHNPLIAFLDSDDEWMDGKLALQRGFLQSRPDVLFCFSDIAYREDSGQEQHAIVPTPAVAEVLGPGRPFSSFAALPPGSADFAVYVGNLYLGQMQTEFVSVTTLLYRRDGAPSVRFPEDLQTREDWEFVGRLARNGPAAYMDCETTWAHKHSGPQLTKLPYVVYLENRLRLLERVWGADQEFLEKHRDAYQCVRHDIYWRLIRERLCEGESEEVRKELSRAQDVHFWYRMLSGQPVFVNRIAFRLRDLMSGNR